MDLGEVSAEECLESAPNIEVRLVPASVPKQGSETNNLISWPKAST
jgi:hypothetical protein